MAAEETRTPVPLSVITFQLFLSHLLLYCLSHTASRHLKCARVWQSCLGLRRSLTLLAVTIHPPGWTCLMFRVLLWRMEIGGNVPGGSKDLSGVFCQIRPLIYTQSKMDLFNNMLCAVENWLGSVLLFGWSKKPFSYHIYNILSWHLHLSVE